MNRERIRDALATVPGLSASLVRPDVIESGSAWPVLTSRRPLNMDAEFPEEQRWAVYVGLPASTLDTAMEDGDAYFRPVTLALLEAGIWVSLVEPMTVQVGPQSPETVPALRFTLEI